MPEGTSRAVSVCFENGTGMFDTNGMKNNRAILAVHFSVSSFCDDSVVCSAKAFAGGVMASLINGGQMKRDLLLLEDGCEDYEDMAELIIRINCEQKNIKVIARGGEVIVNCSFDRFSKLFARDSL